MAVYYSLGIPFNKNIHVQVCLIKLDRSGDADFFWFLVLQLEGLRGGEKKEITKLRGKRQQNKKRDEKTQNKKQQEMIKQKTIRKDMKQNEKQKHTSLMIWPFTNRREAITPGMLIC